MKIKFGTRWEQTWTRRGVLEVYPEWRDLWVGVFISKDAVYVVPFPCVVLRFSRGTRKDPVANIQDAIREAMRHPYAFNLGGIIGPSLGDIKAHTLFTEDPKEEKP